MGDLLVERDDHVTVLTLNRPDRLNAISGEMLRELSARLQEANASPEVRVVVLTGAGRGFCSGLDLKDVASGSSDLIGEAAPAFDIENTPPFVLRRLDVPVICALNGVAAGYGMDLALGCDIVLASDRARLSAPVRRGLVPESGGTWLLPRLVGWHRACEILLRGSPLDADDLRAMGLVNRIVPHDQLADEARTWAGEIASNAPLAVAATKRTLRLGLDTPFEANGLHVMAELAQLLRSRDFREGLQAFLEKRDPQYSGR